MVMYIDVSLYDDMKERKKHKSNWPLGVIVSLHSDLSNGPATGIVRGEMLIKSLACYPLSFSNISHVCSHGKTGLATCSPRAGDKVQVNTFSIIGLLFVSSTLS